MVAGCCACLSVGVTLVWTGSERGAPSLSLSNSFRLIVWVLSICSAISSNKEINDSKIERKRFTKNVRLGDPYYIPVVVVCVFDYNSRINSGPLSSLVFL